MKPRILRGIGTYTAALLVTLLVACGLATTPVAEAQEAAAKPAAATATPAGALRYDALPTVSKMTIAGTSTMHDWTMESRIVGGFVEADAKFPESPLTNPQAARPNVQVKIPVKSFKSNSKRMDSSAYEYLKEPQFKSIDYRLLELKPKSASGATGPLQFDAVGALTIVGTTLTNTMPVTIEKVDGKLKIIGSTPIKCTDYKLKPFSFLVVSCGDDLKISFEWVLAPKVP